MNYSEVKYRTTSPATANPKAPVTNVADPKPHSQFNFNGFSELFTSDRLLQTVPSFLG